MFVYSETNKYSCIWISVSLNYSQHILNHFTYLLDLDFNASHTTSIYNQQILQIV